MIKKLFTIATVAGISAMSMAQEATGLDLTEYMENLTSEAESQVETLLPLLGDVAVIGLVVFLAIWAFRVVKRFLGGR